METYREDDYKQHSGSLEEQEEEEEEEVSIGKVFSVIVVFIIKTVLT